MSADEREMTVVDFSVNTNLSDVRSGSAERSSHTGPTDPEIPLTDPPCDEPSHDADSACNKPYAQYEQELDELMDCGSDSTQEAGLGVDDVASPTIHPATNEPMDDDRVAATATATASQTMRPPRAMTGRHSKPLQVSITSPPPPIRS